MVMTAPIPHPVPTAFDTRDHGFWREHDRLVVCSGVTLPKRCIRTGSAQGLTPQPLVVYWRPTWAFVLAFVVPCFGPLILRAARRSAQITVFATAAVHDRCRLGRIVATAIEWAPFVLGVLALLLGKLGVPGWALMMLAALLVSSPSFALAARIRVDHNFATVVRIEAELVYLEVPRCWWAGLQSWSPSEHAITRSSFDPWGVTAS
jgi:hypothetical protein